MKFFCTISAFFASCCLLLAQPAAAVHFDPATRAATKPAAGTTRPATRRPARRPVARPVAVAAAPQIAPTAAAVALPTARPVVNITGTVYGPNGRVLPGVCVSLLNTPGRMAVSNADGEFLLADVPATVVLHLQANFQGLKTVQLDADAQNAKTVSVVMNQR